MLRRAARTRCILASPDRRPSPHGLVGDHQIHADVVLLQRQIVDHEPLVTHADADRVGHPCQETVVHAPSAAEATTLRVEGDAGHDDDVDGARSWPCHRTGSERSARRFADPERPSDEPITGRVGHDDQPIVLDPGQQDRPARWGHVEERGEIRLVRIGRVQQDRAGLTQLREFAQGGDDPRGRGDDLRAGQRATLGEQLTSPHALLVGDRACATRHGCSVGRSGRPDPYLRGPGGPGQYARATHRHRRPASTYAPSL